MMDAELDRVKVIYDQQMARVSEDGYGPVHRNFPKVSLTDVC